MPSLALSHCQERKDNLTFFSASVCVCVCVRAHMCHKAPVVLSLPLYEFWGSNQAFRLFGKYFYLPVWPAPWPFFEVRTGIRTSQARLKFVL